MAQRDEWGRPLYSGKNDSVYWSREEWADEHGDDDPGPDEDDDAVDFEQDASDDVEEPDEDIDGDDVECDDWGC